MSEEKILEAYRSRVMRIARGIRNARARWVKTEDFMQAGMIGLLEASRHFDESRGGTFWTYARYRVRGAIMDELRTLDRVPRNLRTREREDKLEHYRYWLPDIEPPPTLFEAYRLRMLRKEVLGLPEPGRRLIIAIYYHNRMGFGGGKRGGKSWAARSTLKLQMLDRLRTRLAA